MTTYEGIATRPRGQLLRLAERVSPLVWAVAASRLLIVLTAVMTTAVSSRGAGWAFFDPTRLSASLGVVGNALTADSVRWDALHYLSVAAHGYKPAGDTQFFPLYPLLIRALGWITGSDVVAGLLISLTAFGVGLLLLYKLASEELGERAARAAVLLLAFAPLSFFFTAIYTESLLLALSVGTFYLARHGRFGPACVLAALVSITHGQGVLIVAPLAYMYWERRGSPRSPRSLPSLFTWEAALLLLPIGTFASVFVYQHAIGFGWLAPITSSRSIGHARMLVVNSQSTRPIGGGTEFPWVTIWKALTAGISGLWQLVHGGPAPVQSQVGEAFAADLQNVIYLVVLMITLLSLAICWKRLPRAYSIYATLVVTLFTARFADVEPLLSFDRYMLPLFPLWMSFAAWIEERRLTRRVVELSTVMLVLYAIEFARWAFIA